MKNWEKYKTHPRRPRGSQSGRENRRDESFQVRAKEPLGTDSRRTISENSSRCRLLIGHKKCFVLLCPIVEQLFLSSFREFVHDDHFLDHGLSGSCTKQKKPTPLDRSPPLHVNRALNFLLSTIHRDPSETEFSQCKLNCSFC